MAKKVIFWPFLAFDGRLGGLKGPLEVRVEHETCRTIHGTHLECTLSQKNLTGLAGGVRNGRNRSESDLFAHPMEIQGLDKTNPLMKTRSNTLYRKLSGKAT